VLKSNTSAKTLNNINVMQKKLDQKAVTVDKRYKINCLTMAANSHGKHSHVHATNIKNNY